MSESNKQIIRNILSVVAGVLIATGLFMLGGLILLFNIASKVKGHGEESDLGNITLSGIILLVVCCFAGGFVTGRISTKKDMIHGTITGIVLITLLSIISQFPFDKESIISYLTIIPATLVGTYVAVRTKRKNLQ